MFCSTCGAGIQANAAFCVSCGAPVKRGAAPPVAPSSEFSCPWCRAAIDPAQLSCPRCGATVNTPPVATDSGWAKLPGRKDTAKLQFGNSFCQIEGTYVPVADLNLAGSDSVYFKHHVLLW